MQPKSCEISVQVFILSLLVSKAELFVVRNRKSQDYANNTVIPLLLNVQFGRGGGDAIGCMI